jgi:hypothetical protein
VPYEGLLGFFFPCVGGHIRVLAIYIGMMCLLIQRLRLCDTGSKNVLSVVGHVTGDEK